MTTIKSLTVLAAGISITMLFIEIETKRLKLFNVELLGGSEESCDLTFAGIQCSEHDIIYASYSETAAV